MFNIHAHNIEYSYIINVALGQLHDAGKLNFSRNDKLVIEITLLLEQLFKAISKLHKCLCQLWNVSAGEG